MPTNVALTDPVSIDLTLTDFGGFCGRDIDQPCYDVPFIVDHDPERHPSTQHG
jgi:hypothetical protein